MEERLLMIEKLNALTEQGLVEVLAGADCADKSGVYFSLYGKLERPEEGYERYYLRIGDTPYGVTGICFHPSQVMEIEKRASGLPRIVLKAKLAAGYDD